MKSLADGLPPAIAEQIHPDWRRNEASYWIARDRLLDTYHGQWIGFANGAVIASGPSAVEVFRQADASGLHPFVTCVGREDEPCQMRRCRFAYDVTETCSLRAPLWQGLQRHTAGSGGHCGTPLGASPFGLDPSHPAWKPGPGWLGSSRPCRLGPQRCRGDEDVHRGRQKARAEQDGLRSTLPGYRPAHVRNKDLASVS